MEINVLIDKGLEECPAAGWLKKVVGQVLDAQDAGADVELSLVITGEEQVRQLNLSYRGRDEPTDVLAFSLASGEEAAARIPDFVLPPDDIMHLGEVIISCPRAVIQAKEHKHPAKKEIAILIIHGVLHLLGYDHGEPEQKAIMEAREKEILGRLTVD